MAYDIGKEESERIQFMKLVFCIMVVFIHSYTAEVNFADTVVTAEKSPWMGMVQLIVSKVISGCAVPGFFTMSAVLLYRKDFSWRDNVKRKIQTLLVPYFILNTFWIAFFYAASSIKALGIFFSSSLFRVPQWGIKEWLDAYLGITRDPVLYPLWFVRDLFVLNMAARVLKLVIDRIPKIWFVFIMSTLALNIDSGMFFLSTQALAFFSLGYYIVKYGLTFSDLDKVPAAVAAFLYAALAMANYLTIGMAVHTVFCALSDIAGVFFCAWASRYFPGMGCKSKLLWVSKYNFSIYLFHELNLSILRKIWFKMFPADIFLQEASYFLLPLFIIPSCILLSRIMEMAVPGLYRTVTGGRKQ